MSRCNLSYKQVTRYLNLMRQRGLVKKEEPKEVAFVTTHAGKSFLIQYNNLSDLLHTSFQKGSTTSRFSN
jgi:predicted transcriptional regulator